MARGKPGTGSAKIKRRHLISKELAIIRKKKSKRGYRRIVDKNKRKKAIVHYTENDRPFIMTRAKEGGTRRLYLEDI